MRFDIILIALGFFDAVAFVAARPIAPRRPTGFTVEPLALTLDALLALVAFLPVLALRPEIARFFRRFRRCYRRSRDRNGVAAIGGNDRRLRRTLRTARTRRTFLGAPGRPPDVD